MVQYACFRCGYLSEKKSSMRLHLNRKNICEPILRDIDLNEYSKDILGRRKFIETDNFEEIYQNIPNPYQIIPNPYQNIPKLENSENLHECKYCNKIYKQRFTLTRHLKTCKMKEIADVEESEIRVLNERIDAYKSEINALKSSVMVNNNTQNNTQNININIGRLAYNQTNYDVVSSKEMQFVIRSSLKCVPNIVKLTHFNEKHPENHNIYISSWKSGNVVVYNGKKWDTQNWNTFSERFVSNNIDTISDWLCLNGEDHPYLVEKFANFIKNQDNDKFLKELSNEIKLIFYNNRSTVTSPKIEKIEEVSKVPNNLQIEA
jgi:hypothetical protein